ncbi:hypothetical protein [Nostoc sp. ChiVER01]|nr:hypothetical protein [Nostoc sp. ChiVER01]MDZ8224799.1 hypothetical protein [Nostoc sp. ChiVER01]
MTTGVVVILFPDKVLLDKVTLADGTAWKLRIVGGRFIEFS